MHTREVVSGAYTVSVTLDLYHFEHVLGLVGAGFCHQHTGNGQSVFVKSPAVHGVEIHDGGLGMIICFEAVIDIRRASEFARDPNCAVPNRQGSPIFTLRLGDDGVKFRLTFEDGAERESLCAGFIKNLNLLAVSRGGRNGWTHAAKKRESGEQAHYPETNHSMVIQEPCAAESS